jgi:hypothetical protein
MGSNLIKILILKKSRILSPSSLQGGEKTLLQSKPKETTNEMVVWPITPS